MNKPLFISLFIILTSLCAFCKEGRTTMFIKLQKDTFAFGDSIPVEVVFVNTTGEKQVLNEDPQKSLDLLLHMVNVATKEDLNFAIGTMTITRAGGDVYAMAVPVKQKFELGPKSVYSFIADANGRLFLSPGRYECFLTSYIVEKSNVVPVSISFTVGSVSYLLATAVDERYSYGKREWALEWLKKIKPGLDVQLTLEEDSDDQKRKKIMHNKKVFDDFKKWWDAHKNDDDIQKAIRVLNQF